MGAVRLVRFWREERGRFKLRVKQAEALRVLGFVPRSFDISVGEGGAVEIEFRPDGSGRFTLWRTGGALERVFQAEGVPRAPLYLKEWAEREGRRVMVLRPLPVGDAVRVARSAAGLVVRVPWRVAAALSLDPGRPILARFRRAGERELTVEFLQP